MKTQNGKTIAIIPARGGSKGIPKKNLVKLGGKPLIAWPISVAKQISQIDRVIVSSDDDEIIQVAKKYGAEVLFRRPAELSADAVPTFPVLLHCLEYLLQNECYEVENVLLLYPTTPFLRPKRILQGLKMLSRSECSSVVGVRKVRGLLWKSQSNTSDFKPFYPKNRVNRQQFSKLYEEAGNIFFTKASVILHKKTLIDITACQFIVIDDEEDLDIDSLQDLKKARKLVGSFI